MHPTIPSLTPTAAQRFLNTISTLTRWFGLSVPPIVDVDYLRSLPTGSFGRAWADNLDAHGLKPLTEGLRRQQLHDGIHVLTGYGTDPLGETEVQAFLIGAKFRLAHVLLTLGLLRGILRQYRQRQIEQPASPESLQAEFSKMVWPRLWYAYQRGRQSTLDPDTWQPELLWHLDLEAVRDRFRLKSGNDVFPNPTTP
ncbi:MAG: hypothetical protein AAFW84_08880 [Cyanobacteria bacterium J06635_15]